MMMEDVLFVSDGERISLPRRIPPVFRVFYAWGACRSSAIGSHVWALRRCVYVSNYGKERRI